METFWPWWWGGAAVAVIAVAYPAVTRLSLGVSGSYVAALDWLERLRAPKQTEPPAPAQEESMAEALRRMTEEQFGAGAVTSTEDAALQAGIERHQQKAQHRRGRPWFLVGIVLGAAGVRLVEGDWPGRAMSLGREFDARFGDNVPLTLALLFACGLAIGVGTRMSGGCTSGHGISGVACGQPGSLLSTATFWGVGVGVTWLLTAVLA